MQDKTTRLCSFGNKVGLVVNGKETQILKINNTRQESINLTNNNLEEVEELTYLESVISKDRL